MKLSIVVPAYNEEKRLPPMLQAYLPYFAGKYGTDFQLIVAVNGSKDRTAERAREFGRQYPQLIVLEEKNKIGKGGAILMGFRAARGALTGFVDADGSTGPDAFDDLVEHIGDAGAIIASRWRRESVVSPKQPLARRVASRIFNGLVRMLFGLRITDTQCGAKLMRREAIVRVMPVIGITRWAFDVDLLFQLKRAGYAVIERPTVWHDVGGSQLNVSRASFEMFVAICRLRLIYSPLRWIVTLYDHTIGRFIHITS